MQYLEPFLKIGMTFASLQLLGTIPVSNEALKMNSGGSETTLFNDFKIYTGRLEGPTAFPDFKLPITVSIFLVEVGDTKKLSSTGWFKYYKGSLLTSGILLVVSVPMFAK